MLQWTYRRNRTNRVRHRGLPSIRHDRTNRHGDSLVSDGQETDSAMDSGDDSRDIQAANGLMHQNSARFRSSRCHPDCAANSSTNVAAIALSGSCVPVMRMVTVRRNEGIVREAILAWASRHCRGLSSATDLMLASKTLPHKVILWLEIRHCFPAGVSSNTKAKPDPAAAAPFVDTCLACRLTICGGWGYGL